MKRYRAWRRRRILRHSELHAAPWDAALARLPLLAGLETTAYARLRKLAIIFLHEKAIEPVGDFRLSETMSLMLSLQACLPILNLGLDWYRGWVSVIVYPGDFVTHDAQIDAAGVVHTHPHALSGEAWLQGPVILAWPDVAHGGIIDGHNLVIHELAHKLDMLNGVANGMPPLHQGMVRREWTQAFSQAFADLEARLATGRPLPIDPYATESPAEFFAVVSEVFFERPAIVCTTWPKVYTQLCAFYRLDPGQVLHQGARLL